MFINLLRVEEGGSSFLMEDHLLVRDTDSPKEKLRVLVRSRPRHGRLELLGVELSEGKSFHLQDLKALRVRYECRKTIHTNENLVNAMTYVNVFKGILISGMFMMTPRRPRTAWD